jgi:hypothetical protein
MAAHSPIVIGNIANRMTPTPGAVLDVVAWGLDIIRRPFACLTADFQRLVPAKLSPDAEFPRMYLQSYSEARIEGLLSESELTYAGLKSGGFPMPLVTRSREDRTASIERTVVNSGGGGGERIRQYDVIFRTPVVNIRYLTDGSESSFTTTIATPTMLQSHWQLVENTTANQSVPVRGTSFPASPNWTLDNDGGIKVPVPGTPFFDVSINYFWLLQ